MASITERLSALGTATVNRAVTNAQWLRLATAIAHDRGLDIATLSQSQQAQLILDFALEALRTPLRQYEGVQAAQAAQSAAAASVNSDFTPTP
jgi:hypothetical protein